MRRYRQNGRDTTLNIATAGLSEQDTANQDLATHK